MRNKVIQNITSGLFVRDFTKVTNDSDTHNNIVETPFIELARTVPDNFSIDSLNTLLNGNYKLVEKGYL